MISLQSFGFPTFWAIIVFLQSLLATSYLSTALTVLFCQATEAEQWRWALGILEVRTLDKGGTGSVKISVKLGKLVKEALALHLCWRWRCDVWRLLVLDVHGRCYVSCAQGRRGAWAERHRCYVLEVMGQDPDLCYFHVYLLGIWLKICLLSLIIDLKESSGVSFSVEIMKWRALLFWDGILFSL